MRNFQVNGSKGKKFTGYQVILSRKNNILPVPG